MTFVDGEECAAGAWASGTGPPVTTDVGAVTLLEGSTFCISSRSGDVARDRPHGLFMADTRVLSCWRLAIDGQPVESLSTVQEPTEPYRATFIGRTPPRRWAADSTMLVLRTRHIGDGMREHIVLRNFGPEPVGITLTVAVDSDFADLFAVKEGRVTAPHGITVDLGSDSMTYTMTAPGHSHVARITATGEPTVTPGRFTFEVLVPGRGEWSASLDVTTASPHRQAEDPHRPGAPLDVSAPERRLRAWRLSNPVVTTPDAAFNAALRAGAEDLGSLQIDDPEQPGCPILAAGAPWFMALFGRDSLLTGWMALGLDPRLALCTLRTLARLQGTRIDPRNEEQPGRILHEVRLGREAKIALGGGTTYYGTVDATPLFVMLLGELDRWGALPDGDRRFLVAAADRALEWITEYGDADGDGFVEYQRHTDSGLLNQGWKDSFDGVTHADGHTAVPPIALCEVQGYVYAAYLARAALAEHDADLDLAASWRVRAAELKEAFNRAFWMPEVGAYALALDGAKHQVDAVASNMAHCLWTGIADDDKAAAVAAHVAGPAMSSGFGIRTLAATMTAYNPMSYHNGSIWPHDNAIAVAGLARYGFLEEAQRISLDLIDASVHFGGRWPELFCGLDRTAFPRPVPYPTSCSPQAWASAAPRLLLRSLLQFNPDVPQGTLEISPALPDRLLPLRLEGMPLAGARIDIAVGTDGSVEIDGLPAGIELETDRRQRVHDAR
ncbi:glycogen debranching N-terminal domain-containing protein [Mycobacterium kyogaense]|uniref:amylo-alpha-1,6-glucosidase n=1 Tax=Mycobacterium kyogaense TaxID=2212479 RepID=UPI000DABD3F3|nr:glycogen debranching N-terminal domain-containing protein [Mycobacterium kyogaense]